MEVLFSSLPTAGSRSAVFLDRDGVINERVVGGYVTRPKEFRFLTGACDMIRHLCALNLPVIVVSNQAGIGKGLIDRKDLAAITQQFVADVRDAGGRINGVYYCTHTPEEKCPCRKPRPGLLRQAAAQWRIDLSRSVLIGDSISDVQAARTAGCKAILFERDHNSNDVPSDVVIVKTLAEVAERVRDCLASPSILSAAGTVDVL